MGRTYIETFDEDLGGWLGWMAGGGGPLRLERRDGAMISRSPWGVDINHAPPGAGYLHLLFCLLLARPEAYPHAYDRYSDANRFVADGYPRDLRNAKFTARLRGGLHANGAQLLLLTQTTMKSGVVDNRVLSGQPLQVTPDWSEQTLTLEPDEAQWTPLGVRRHGADNDAYGNGPVDEALADVNVNIILVLFPLDIAPARPFEGDLHDFRAGIDYALDASRLPSGHVAVDEVRIDFAV